MNKKIFIAIAFATMAFTGSVNAFAGVDLQGENFEIDTISRFPIGPGITQTKLTFSNASRRFNASLLELDRMAGENIKIKVDVGRDSCNTAEAITSIAKRKTTDATQYIGGINGDFFITSAFAAQHEFGNAILGYPNMSCVIDGKIVAPDMIDITSRENAFIVGADGLWIDATDLKYQIVSVDGSTTVNATAINYPRRDNELMLYNGYIGNYTKTSDAGREIVLKPAEGETWAVNRPIRFVVEERHNGQSLIPADGLVISCGPKYSNAFIDALQPGDTVLLNISLTLPAFDGITPDIDQVCGGDVRILNSGITTTDAIRWINTPSARYSRSLVGYSEDRNKVILCAVDASSASSGVTYFEAADLMRFLGCYDALDLDGGGSTAIWSHSHGIFNNLRDGSERAVGNGIFFVLDAPADSQIASIHFEDHQITLPRYAMYRPVIYGYNAYGSLVELNVEDFELIGDESLGEIQADGKSILVNGEGSHILTARLHDMTATVTVNIDNNASAYPRVNAYLLDGYHPVGIELLAQVGSNMMDVAPQAYEWSSGDESIVTVDSDGVLTGLRNGTTIVTGRLGDNVIELSVTVEKPSAAVLPVYESWNPDDWKLTRSSLSSATAVPNAEVGGFDVTYKVSSTRAPRLTMTCEKAIYSCPDKVSVTFGQNEMAVTGLTINVLAANANRSVSLTANEDELPEAGEIRTIEFDLSEAFNLADPGIYPIHFVSAAFGAPAKVDTFTLQLCGIDAAYSFVESGVDDIMVRDSVAEKLICRIEGNRVQLPFVADSIEIYNTMGALVGKATDTDRMELPIGFYIVRATKCSKILSTSIIIR